MANRKKTSSLYILLIATAVILFWRGAWGLMDLVVFPNDELHSYSASLILGITILLITHRLKDILS